METISRPWRDSLVAAARSAREHDLPTRASAVAYSAFFAIPSTLLVTVGVFGLVADEGALEGLLERLERVAPPEATELLRGSLETLLERPGTGIVLTAVGLILALWTVTGAMSALIAGIDAASGERDERGFLRRRSLAARLVATVGSLLVVVSLLFVLGPLAQGWLGRALDAERTVSIVWWSLEIPLVLTASVAAFAALFAFAPHRSSAFRSSLAAAVLTAVVWIAVSTGFMLYTSLLGSYDQAWGALSTVVVTLTWLWLSAAVILFGAELDAARRRADTADDVPPLPPERFPGEDARA